ncbi:helix-turn-helix domain-containing protein [Nocardia sp. CDC153]|uniref:AraC-like ligand-binding domain-containing protein n=1 Tax=Nocardia sp. CDC153 TaxID=3112167 RepID=UPI002DBAF155|nr:helix-turn-helix domain-containing protein [Nocardia sp. CDC153]MEC3954974.1 helix-turn-helix domain-containing protein [Nocardia sp. CDC153]
MDASGAVDRIEVRSGPEQSSAEAFERWEAQVNAAYVPLAVSPKPTGRFHGYIEHARYDELDLSVIGSVPQVIARTAPLISRTNDEYLLASIPTMGVARLHQDGRIADVGPGGITFYDSTRPYHWDARGEFEQVVVQVPLSRLRDRYGLENREIPTATIFSSDTAPGIVAQFFRGVAGLQRTDPTGAALLAEPGMDLLAAAVVAASGRTPRDQSADALNRQRVLAFMRNNCADPDLGVDRIAEGCRMSRRTLYRVFGEFEGGPGTVLRRMRIERACDLLRNAPQLPLSAVAKASGFLTERSFYRSFRLEMGTTPGAFRALA